MILSTSSFNINKRVLVVLSSFFLFFSGCANIGGQAFVARPVAVKNVLLAVYPITNLTGKKAPLKETRQLVIGRLQAQGVNVLSDEALEKIMVRHRIRYVGGLSREESESFKSELGIDAVLIIFYELYDDGYPPKIALTARLVSTGGRPVILWSESVGLAGDDRPGILGLGLVSDPQILLDRAVLHLSDSLIDYLSSAGIGMREIEAGSGDERSKELSGKTVPPSSVWNLIKDLFGSFKPRSYYITPFMDAHKRYSVVVMPFQNRSGRINAGDVLMLEFIRQLASLKEITVIDPGIVRQTMLDERIMMRDSISLADFDLITSRVGADLVLAGTVTDYYDYQGPVGTCYVAFSVLLIEKKQRMTVFSSDSHNTGDDRITVFDLGKIRTASSLTSEMVQATVGLLSKGLDRRELKKGVL